MCFDTDNDGGIRVISGVDTVETLAIDLRGDHRIDESERTAIVAEMGDWMFTRPIQDHLRAALESV